MYVIPNRSVCGCLRRYRYHQKKTNGVYMYNIQNFYHEDISTREEIPHQQPPPKCRGGAFFLVRAQ